MLLIHPLCSLQFLNLYYCPGCCFPIEKLRKNPSFIIRDALQLIGIIHKRRLLFSSFFLSHPLLSALFLYIMTFESNFHQNPSPVQCGRHLWSIHKNYGISVSIQLRTSLRLCNFLFSMKWALSLFYRPPDSIFSSEQISNFKYWSFEKPLKLYHCKTIFFFSE